MLEVDVRHRLGNFALEAAFTAETGTITALFGRSGSGKTSLVNLLAGLLRPDAGRIAVNGKVLFDSATGTDTPPEKRRIGYIFQESRLFPHMNVRKNLCYGQNLLPLVERRIDFDEVIELLDLALILDRGVANLSGGETQRVAIGRALLSSPRLLVMDEPLASLDAPRKSEILPFIERLRDHMDMPVVYVSHALEEIIRLSDTMVLLSDGRVVAAGPVEDLTARLDLFPLTGRYEAGAVLATTIVAHDDEYGLSYLDFAGGRLTVPGIDLPVGSSVKLRIRARDVSLSLHPVKDTSILNTLSGVIAEINDRGGPQLDVAITVGKSRVLARVTRKAATILGLEPGKPIYALMKAVAVDRRSMGRSGGSERVVVP